MEFLPHRRTVESQAAKSVDQVVGPGLGQFRVVDLAGRRNAFIGSCPYPSATGGGIGLATQQRHFTIQLGPRGVGEPCLGDQQTGGVFGIGALLEPRLEVFGPVQTQPPNTVDHVEGAGLVVEVDGKWFRRWTSPRFRGRYGHRFTVPRQRTAKYRHTRALPSPP